MDEVMRTLLREADSLYTPIRPFEDWSGLRVDTETWDRASKAVLAQRQQATTEQLQRAVQVAMRAAAIDTGAIEGLYEVDHGFTLSIALQSLAWQTVVQERGEDIREFFEAQLLTYELALDIATKRMPITEAFIRRLQEEVSRPQRTMRVLTEVGWQDQSLLRGQYKNLPNHVRLPDGGLHSYAPVELTGNEMHRLVSELESPLFASAHPVLQAAYAHYSLVAIHPFQDGNGRVSRALASVYLYRSQSIPLVIFNEQKDEYFEALRRADNGSLQPFIDFMLDRAVDTMGMVADQLAAPVEERVASLRDLLTSQGGLSHSQLNDLAKDLLQDVADEIRPQTEALNLPVGVQVHSQLMQDPLPFEIADSRFRRLPVHDPRHVMVWGRVPPPATAYVQFSIQAVIAKAADERFVFRLVTDGPADPLDIRLRDVHPKLTSSFQLRLAAWLRRLLNELLERLQLQAEESLKESGFP